ncbi:putative signal transducing protein [Brevundimonas vesicularis]|uniref:putative signal transducing protein n=1 Tax=Brevundimonas vesicularis TaxID=41276 RepID=UPI0038D3EF2E
MDRLEVARFSSLPEAEMAAALLIRHGIDARLPDRDTATVVAHMQLALGGLRVTVPDHELEQARALIEAARQGRFADMVDADEDGWREGAVTGMVDDVPEADVQGALRPMKPVVQKVGAVILAGALILWIWDVLA